MRGESLITKKRVAIITNNIHCERHIQYFSTIEKYFSQNGWVVADNFNVNKIVICGCGFHDAMYDKVVRALSEIKKSNFLEKNIIIMACLPKTHELHLKEIFKGQIVKIHQENILDNIIQAKVPFKDISPVNVFKLNQNGNLAEKQNERFIIKISEGCLQECTFCVINKVKGYIKSVPYEQIEKQVLNAIRLDRKNILLVGEDTFAYGVDIGTTIIELVEKIKSIDPTLNLNFGYLHTRWLKKYDRDILSLCERGIITELQIGLQHVNEKLLKKMGRPANVSEIYDIVRLLKNKFPNFYFIVDILIGFPGETEAMFHELVEFLKKDRCFDKVKHFGYSDVRGSLSSTFEEKVPQDVIAHRWEYLNRILGERSYSNQADESRIDNETFRKTRFEDYFFCKNTYDERIEGSTNFVELTRANSNILEKDVGDFDFNCRNIKDS